MLGRNLLMGIVVLFCSLQASIASAISFDIGIDFPMIQVLPDRTMMNVGETLSVDVSISGLGAGGTAPSANGFRIFLGYDPLLFTLGTVTFGDELIDIGFCLFSCQQTEAASNGVTVSHLPYIGPPFTPPDYSDQPSSFLLFNVEFAAISPGVGSFAPDPAQFREASGGDTLFNLAASTAQVEVKNPSAVPVPAAVWLFGTALVGLVGFSKRKARVAA